MAILKNKTQRNFTQISNNILKDKELSMKDRGVLCTICSLPDGWEFSVAGLSKTVPDGINSISKSMRRLEGLGYITWRKKRGYRGQFISEVEVLPDRVMKNKSYNIHDDAFTVVDNPQPYNERGLSTTVNITEYNNKYIRSKYNNKSIYQSNTDKEDEEMYRELIAENIHLEDLYTIAVATASSESEKNMVTEIYNVICDMVIYPRDTVTVCNTVYPWEYVKSQYLKLRYEDICEILNRIIDKDLNIKNMSSYLISTLFMQSTVSTISSQSKIYDDYLKGYRGEPYR